MKTRWPAVPDSRLTVATATSASVVGAVIATTAFVVVPAPLAGRILLVAPLLVVPALLRLPGPAIPRLEPIAQLAGWPTLLAALPLIVAFSVAAGPLALVLALPWLALATLVGLAAFADALPRLRYLRQRDTLDALIVDGALGFLAVGALFLALDRIGVAALGFAPEIILLTAVHFHFAGFALLLIGATLARRLGSTLLTIAAINLAVGMPVTATAFLLDSDLLNAIGAVLVVAGALGAALGLLRLRQVPLLVAGLLLLIGVPFGLAWAVVPLLGTPSLDFEAMIRIHGGLNSGGVLLAALFLPGVRP